MAAAGEAPKQHRVLMCDDQVVCRMHAKRVLLGVGTEVKDVKSGEETLSAWDANVADESERPFSLVVMDNHLGVDVMNGCECIEALRARGCKTKILMLTGAEIT